jgi:hypothetical protein
MTSRDFVIWLKGFTEACNDYTATPKQWDRIKEVLEDVEDYDDNPGIDVEIDDWHPENPGAFRDQFKWPGGLSGTITASGSTSVLNTGVTNATTTVWNDKMGCWHYTNYPEGFGYFTNSTADSKKEKQQLND